jgi:hypothetical protein
MIQSELTIPFDPCHGVITSNFDHCCPRKKGISRLCADKNEWWATCICTITFTGSGPSRIQGRNAFCLICINTSGFWPAFGLGKMPADGVVNA